MEKYYQGEALQESKLEYADSDTVYHIVRPLGFIMEPVRASEQTQTEMHFKEFIHIKVSDVR